MSLEDKAITLPSRPFRGTLSIQDLDGNVIGWDSDGILYASLSSSTVTFQNVTPVKIGDFLLSLGDQVLIYDLAFKTKTDSTSYLRISNSGAVLQDEDTFLLKKDGKLTIFTKNALFTEGESSIVRNPTSQILPTIDIIS